MPKNAGIGGKKRQMGKKTHNFERELVFKEPDQDYAQVLRLMGDCRIDLQCMDGQKRIGHIRGKIKKKVWIAMGDIVLVSLREYEKDKCDILQKYTEDEVRKLKQMGEIPESIKLPENDKKEDDGYGDIVFEGDDDDEEENTVVKKRYNKKDLPSSDSDDNDSDDEKNIDIDAI